MFKNLKKIKRKGTEKVLGAWDEEKLLLFLKVSPIDLNGKEQSKEWAGWEIIYVLNL